MFCFPSSKYLLRKAIYTFIQQPWFQVFQPRSSCGQQTFKLTLPSLPATSSAPTWCTDVDLASPYEVVDLLYTSPEVEFYEPKLNYSTFDIFFHIIMRICNRFSQEEIQFLETATSQPVTLFHNDGKNGKYLPISQVSRLIKQWKTDRKNSTAPMSTTELNQLSSMIHQYENNTMSDVYTNKSFTFQQRVYFNDITSNLPFLP